MQKRVVILTMNPMAGRTYRTILEGIMGTGTAEILVHTPSSYKATGRIPDVDLYLISTSTIDYDDDITESIPFGVPTIDISTAFQKKSIEQVLTIPKETQCLFVNTTEPLALEGIVALHRFSVYNVLLTPMYPGSRDYPDIRVAITPGEPQLVPSYVEKVYDLGHRYLTPGTVAKVLVELNMESIIETETFQHYSAQFHPFDCNDSPLLKKSMRLEAGIDLLVNSMEGGLIGINEEGNIFCINNNARYILGLEDKKWVGCSYVEALPFIDFPEYARLSKQKRSFDKLVQYGSTSLTVGIHTILNNGKFRGLFITVQRFIDVENKQHDARLRLLDKGHTAKYTFDDIIGKSKAMLETCRMAQKMAYTNSAILITGESGTGKELLASAIHNASQRASGPYIAINCAAMPENLLESELFGYENGAFTGAKKNGKLGLFECAHRGTLFLDEIEGMSPALQSKLLRVLQEKEVMRLGGVKIIRVDVRIIAATNVDMETMVKQGAIRKDLYYRLNTMELNLPPLRERREDIPLLICHMQEEADTYFRLSKPVMDRLLAHNWDGNIRELKNYVEFFQCLEKEEISLEDLPKRLQRNTWIEQPIQTDGKQSPVFEKAERSIEQQFILHCLYKSYLEKQLIGRRTICQEAEKVHLFLTEQEIRRLLKELEEQGLVKIGSGRAGSRLTPKGIAAISKENISLESN